MSMISTSVAHWRRTRIIVYIHTSLLHLQCRRSFRSSRSRSYRWTPGNLRICSVSCRAATCHWTYVGAIPEKRWAVPPAYSRRRSRIALACLWSRSSPRDTRGSTFVPPKTRLERRPTRPSSPSMVRDYLFLENTVFFILQLRFVTFLVPCTTNLINSTIVVSSVCHASSALCRWKYPLPTWTLRKLWCDHSMGSWLNAQVSARATARIIHGFAFLFG